ncbi:MAG TPA: type II secretion system F family protein [Longimicrobium sp.]|nr:type II secretion system F family protein [Longimicrobium sp.]
MPAFAYRAATQAGRTVRGVEDAESPAALERTLGARGLYPLEVSPATAAASDGTGRRAFRTRRADVVEAVRYLATLMDAGFPLDRALGAVGRMVARRDVAEAVADVRQRVRGGARLDDALGAHPAIFPRFAVGMVRAGDRGGYLAQALERLANQLEREAALRSRLISALIYPAVMIAVGSGAIAVLFVFVLPRFVTLLNDTGSALPKSTAILLALGQFVSRWWWAILLAPVLLALLVAGIRSTREGRAATDRFLLRLPIVGGLRQRTASARLARTLSTLLGSGLPILPALEIAAGSQADAAVADEVLRSREEVRAGDRLAAALRRGGIFPFLFVQMVEVGEEGGRLPDMLERAASAMEKELERGLERLLRLVEPAMIVLFGGIVGFVALSLLQAIYGIRADGL